jgi:hypothetical protein
MEREDGLSQERLDAALEDTGSPGGADDYQLDDVMMPEGLAECAPFDKAMFIEVMKKRGITIEQARGLWEDYTKMSTDAYMKAQVAAEEKRQAQERNQLSKIEESLEAGDGLHLKPEEAQALIDKITCDMSHPYWNSKSSPLERDKAVALVNRLYDIVAGREVTVEGYLTKMHQGQKERQKNIYGMSTGSGDIDGRSSSNNLQPSQSEEGMGGMPMEGI